MDINTTLLAIRNPKWFYHKVVKADENCEDVLDSEGNVQYEFIYESDGTTKQKLIHCETKWSHLGDESQDWKPFNVTPYDTMAHGQKLWTDLNNGVHGDIDSSDLD